MSTTELSAVLMSEKVGCVLSGKTFLTKSHVHFSNSDTVQQCIKTAQPDCFDTIAHRLEGLRHVIQYTCSQPDKFNGKFRRRFRISDGEG